MSAREIERCKWKLGLCVRNARTFSRMSWQDAENNRQAREFRMEARDAINGLCGARWWRDKLRTVETSA